jgi:hypothetical protein
MDAILSHQAILNSHALDEGMGNWYRHKELSQDKSECIADRTRKDGHLKEIRGYSRGRLSKQFPDHLAENR